jgi:hypothetical protein
MKKFIRTVLRGLGCSNVPRLPDQILETKARFIAQFLSGNTSVREMEDVGDTVLSMAEIKALASGNPKIVERVVLQNEMVKLENLRASWQSNRRDSQRRLMANREEFAQTLTRVEYLCQAVKLRGANSNEQFMMRINEKNYDERKSAGAALIEYTRILKNEAERSGQETRKNVGKYRGFSMWLRVRPNRERTMRSLIDQPGVEADILLDYGVPQVLVAHVSESDMGTVASIETALRSIDAEINKNNERIEYLKRQIATFNTALTEEWEHAQKLESLVAKLAVIDKELIEAGVRLSSSVSQDGEVERNEIEEAVAEPIIESETDNNLEGMVAFNLDEILDRIKQLVASTPAPEEIAMAVPAFEAEPTAIPVTPALITNLKEQAQTAQALAELGEHLLIGSQRQLTLEDLWTTHKQEQATQKKSSKTKQAVAVSTTVQLTLF